jgi:sulfur carrier protein
LYYSNVMEITVNGSTNVYEAPLAIAQLLQKMALAGKKVAVERNGEIVPRSSHAATLLAHGDRLEIVAAVGGG